MKTTFWKKTAVLATAAALGLSLLGCNAGNQPGSAALSEQAGTLLVRVNPEIEMHYDGRGRVLELVGVNEDGQQVVNGLSGYEGRECEDVIRDVIVEINEGGYFAPGENGEAKNIVITLESGSAYPDDDFLEDVSEEAREAVAACGLSTDPVTLAQGDVDETGAITLEKAKELALAHFGVTEAEFVENECRLDDGEYDIEFISGGVEYECEVDIYTGRVKEAEAEVKEDASYIGMEKAKELALAHFGLTEAEFVDKECQLDDGEYDIEFVSGGVKYECEVDARTGAVTEVERENLPGSGSYIGMEKAKELALAHFGLTEAEFMESSLDDGEYDLEFVAGGVKYECEVHAISGAVTEVERETLSGSGSYIGMERAKELALAHFGLTEAEFMETSLDDGEYDLEFVSGNVKYECEVHAISGAVTEVERETLSGSGSYIGMERAKELALAHFGLTEAEFMETSLDDGEYDLEFVSGNVKYECEVHAISGAVTEVDREQLGQNTGGQYDDDWDDRHDDDWDDQHDDDWDDRYDDDWDDDRYVDDWDDDWDDDDDDDDDDSWDD